MERGKFTARPRNDPQFYGGEFPFVQTGDVTHSDGVLRDYSQTLNELGLKVSKLFPKGSILITIAANIGSVAITEIDTACPDSIVVIQAKPGVCKNWLRYALSVRQRELESLATQNAQKNINLQVLRPLKIPTPSIERQKEIADIIGLHDSELSALKSISRLYNTQKRGLMQKLLTGEWPVKFKEAA